MSNDTEFVPEVSVVIRAKGTDAVGQNRFAVDVLRSFPKGGRKRNVVPFGTVIADDIRKACAKALQHVADKGTKLTPVEGPDGEWCIAAKYANIRVEVPRQLP